MAGKAEVGTSRTYEGVIAIYVSAPVASFRNPHAREYLETYRCPPPSTVYGMLLSAVGEVSRRAHMGAEIAYALLSEPELSTVLRTKWRVKSKGVPLGTGNNKVPDFQELLTGLRMVIWVREGRDEAAPLPLARRLADALHGQVKRFGALSLGESTCLVNDFRAWREEDGFDGRLLVKDDENGELSLPVWADHVSSTNTCWGRYRLERCDLRQGMPEKAWVTLAPLR
jgi:CRISPR-associated protein Cas5t